MTKKTKSWIEAELEDTLDEMFEEEFNAPALTEEMRKIYRDKHPNMLDKKTYYRNLLRLQVELIKLQDWVKETGSKLVIICEGRDGAGKGSVIKRITQRMDPRVARVVALPAPTERENRNGISRDLYPIFLLVVKSFYLTVRGIIAPV